MDSQSVGMFKVYLALENAASMNNVVKVIDLTKDSNVYLSSKTVVPFEGKLDDELIEVAERYNYTND